MFDNQSSFLQPALPLLKRVAQFFEHQNRPVYLVGGSLRDLLSQQPCRDWDLVVPGDPGSLARDLASTLGGFYTRLNQKADRVIVKEPVEVTFDLASLKGGSLEEDLRLRDFTINAMALPLNTFLTSMQAGTPVEIIDPLAGLTDVQSNIIRQASPTAFQDDPLRILRAVRLQSRSSFKIEERTRFQIQSKASLLTEVAVERIHEELMLILDADSPLEHLHLLDNLKVLTTLIPALENARGLRQPRPHHWDVLEHSLQTPGMLQMLTQALVEGPDSFRLNLRDEDTRRIFEQIQSLLAQANDQGIFKVTELSSAPMRLAALLHDIGKPPTYTVDEQGNVHFYGHPKKGAEMLPQILKRLGASTQERRLAQQVAAEHMRPGHLAQLTEVTTRAVRRYFVDLGPVGIPVALISLADHLATIGPQEFNQSWPMHLALVHLLLRSYICERDSILPPRLVSPQELIQHFQIQPGPIIGQLLELLSEAQTERKVQSKTEALWFVEEQLKLLQTKKSTIKTEPPERH